MFRFVAQLDLQAKSQILAQSCHHPARDVLRPV
jgi:hypothetical protein